MDRGQPGRGAGRRGRVLPSSARRAVRRSSVATVVHFTDWQGDGDERLDGPGHRDRPRARRRRSTGRHVRGLLWRSHPAQAHFAEQSNAASRRRWSTRRAARSSSTSVCGAAEATTRSWSSFGTARVRDDDVAFVGGIDLCHGRHDDSQHARRSARPSSSTTATATEPPWHDVQLEVRGPAVGDLEHTFRERWEDPTPLDHRNPWRIAARQAHAPAASPRSAAAARAEPRAARDARRAGPSHLPGEAAAASRSRPKASAASHARISRRSGARADSSTWRTSICGRSRPRTRSPTRCGASRAARRRGRAPLSRPRRRATSAANRIGREHVHPTSSAGPAATASRSTTSRTRTEHRSTCTPRSASSTTSLVVGSDNLNRRSWTHDSEISCSVIDATLDERAPTDPGGLGDGARRLARDTRLRLWREHLGRADGDDADLVDPADGFAALAASRGRPRPLASRREARTAPAGSPPPTRSRTRQPNGRDGRPTLYRIVLDPDGRPRNLRRTHAV